MSKHGPRAKAGARYPCGKLRPASDGPTPEHERHRRELVGTDTPKKQALASHELGIRFARHDISGPEFSAGKRYARLFRSAVRPRALPSILGNLIAGGNFAVAMANLDYGVTIEKDAEDRTEYLDARKALGSCGSRTAGIVNEIAVYDHPCAAAKGEANHKDFCRGLDALQAHFEAIDARSRAARG